MTLREVWHLLGSLPGARGVCRGLSQRWAGSSEATQPFCLLAGLPAGVSKDSAWLASLTAVTPHSWLDE